MGNHNHWDDERWERLTKRLCADFGPEAAAKIIESLVYEIGGERMTFPSVQDLSRKHRDIRIYMLRQKGYSYAELAVNFELSKLSIRRIERRFAHQRQGNGKSQAGTSEK